jgi:molecular chaperone DnaJ
LRFQGKGDDVMKEVAPGDLYVKINVVAHHTFIRMGYHLVTSVDIDYFDAMLGTEKEIPTIEGGKIKMRVPAGIHPGQSLRAAGKGMPVGNGNRGDMMVEVVFAPSKLTDEQRELVEKARSLNG